jgi:hypothetical protein
LKTDREKTGHPGDVVLLVVNIFPFKAQPFILDVSNFSTFYPIITTHYLSLHYNNHKETTQAPFLLTCSAVHISFQGKGSQPA